MVRARTVLLGALSLVGLGLRAADEKDKSADDSLSVTRRELETMKRDGIRPSGNSPQLALPDAIEHPSLPALSGARLISDSKRKQQELLKAKGRSANWLADGVHKNSTRNSSDFGKTPRDPARANAENVDQENADDVIDPVTGQTAQPTANSEHSPDKSEAGEKGRDLKSAKDSAPANPLARYMGDWMTSSDYALLKKTGNLGAPAGAEVKSSGGSPALTGELGSPISDSSAFSGGTPNSWTGNLSAEPRENPFLAAITLPPPPNTGGPSIALAPISSPPEPPRTSAVLPPAPMPPDPRSPSYLQENFKRADDAKYFPQLKRF